MENQLKINELGTKSCGFPTGDVPGIPCRERKLRIADRKLENLGDILR